MADQREGRRVQRKRPRTMQRIKETEVCHTFACAGECRFGDACKYSHDLDACLGDGAGFYRAQAQWRDGQQKLSEGGDGSVVASAAAFSEYPHPPFHTTVECAPNEETSLVIHAHKNGVIALCLAKTHPALIHGNGKIDKVIFSEQSTIELLDTIATVQVENVTYNVKSPMAGTLIETNLELINNPGLLSADPIRNGHLLLMKARKPFQFFLTRFFLVRAITNEYADEVEGDA